MQACLFDSQFTMRFCQLETQCRYFPKVIRGHWMNFPNTLEEICERKCKRKWITETFHLPHYRLPCAAQRSIYQACFESSTRFCPCLSRTPWRTPVEASAKSHFPLQLYCLFGFTARICKVESSRKFIKSYIFCLIWPYFWLLC